MFLYIVLSWNLSFEYIGIGKRIDHNVLDRTSISCNMLSSNVAVFDCRRFRVVRARAAVGPSWVEDILHITGADSGPCWCSGGLR